MRLFNHLLCALGLAKPYKDEDFKADYKQTFGQEYKCPVEAVNALDEEIKNTPPPSGEGTVFDLLEDGDLDAQYNEAIKKKGD